MRMQTRLEHASHKSIAQAAAHLRAGDLVAVPTETVYGLAANAFNEIALARVFAAKERPECDPLIVHIAPPQDDSNKTYVDYLEDLHLLQRGALPENVRTQLNALLQEFWPGPLTVVVPKTSQVPDLATSGLPRVGVRMPSHPVMQELIRQAGFPLAAPSANRFGRISPTTAQAVDEELHGRIPFILDGGPCSVGVESTVLGVLPDGGFELLRPGGVTRQDLERALKQKLLSPGTASTQKSQVAPGLLASHYAPSKPLILLKSRLSEFTPQDWTELKAQLTSKPITGLLAFSGTAEASMKLLEENLGVRSFVFTLSEMGDVAEAARHLFSMLRALDASLASVLLAEPPPTDLGLGHAILDRLTRAAAKRD